HAPYEALRERIPPLAGALTPIDGGRCELQTGAYTLRSLAAWLATTDLDFDVLEPAELIEHLRDVRGRIDRTLARAGRGRGSPRPRAARARLNRAGRAIAGCEAPANSSDRSSVRPARAGVRRRCRTS